MGSCRTLLQSSQHKLHQLGLLLGLALEVALAHAQGLEVALPGTVSQTAWSQDQGVWRVALWPAVLGGWPLMHCQLHLPACYEDRAASQANHTSGEVSAARLGPNNMSSPGLQ